MPRRALEELVKTDIAVVDVGLAVPVFPVLCGFPPLVEAPSYVLAIGENVFARRAVLRQPAKSILHEPDTVLMLEKCINHVEQMPGQLRQRARTAWELVSQIFFRKLPE